MDGGSSFNAVKVFSATTAQDRGDLGTRITRWWYDHPDCELIDRVVTQSSDEAFHCVTVTLFYRTRAG